MAQIGIQKRQLFVEQRREELASFLHQDTATYPNPTQHYDDYTHRFGITQLSPANVSIIPVNSEAEVEDYRQNPNAVDFYLAPLKGRSIDPIFYNKAGKLSRLSAVDPNFKALLSQQRQLMKQAYVARIHTNSEVCQIVKAGLEETDVEWQDALNYPRMPPDTFRTFIRDSVGYAAVNRMVGIDWRR